MSEPKNMFHTGEELNARQMTGRVRPRIGWFGRVYMQVEVKSPMPRYPKPPRPDRNYSVWDKGSYTYWRDARPSDFIQAHQLSGILETVGVVHREPPAPPPNRLGLVC